MLTTPQHGLRRKQDVESVIDQELNLLRDLEDELRTEKDPVDKARLRREIVATHERIWNFQQELERLTAELRSTALGLADEVEDYLVHAGWGREGESEINPRGEVDLFVERQERGLFRKVLVRCIDGEATPSVLRRFQDEPSPRPVSERWLLAASRVHPVARDLADGNPELRVSSLDDLVAEIFPTAGHFARIEGECSEGRIEDYYVELAGTRPAYDDEGREIGRAYLDSVEEYLDRWLHDGGQSHISVLGDFGSGKSWLCRHYALRRLRRYREWPRQERIPILVRLHDFAQLMGVEDLFEVLGQRSGIQASGELFQWMNAQGRLLLILDGFDEMARKMDPEAMVRNFNTIARLAVPQSKIILTCRKPYFRTNLEVWDVLGREEEARIDLADRPHFAVIDLEPFDGDQVQEVLRRRIGPDWEAYAERITRTYDLPDLVRRPVMLTMTIEVLPALAGRERITVYDLYKTYTERWIQAVGEERSYLDPATRQRFMRTLAWKMYEEERLEIHHAEIESLVESFYQLPDRAELNPYENDIRSQSYLVRDQQGYYFFAHKSFMEFFVAEALHEKIRQGDPTPFGERPVAPAVLTFLRELDYDPEQLYRWIREHHQDPALKFMVGNALTLLRHTDFDFRRRDFSSMTILSADLSGVDLEGCSFSGARLDDVNLSDTNLSHCDFRGAVLTHLNLGVRSSAKAVRCSPDGRFVATGRGDNRVVVLAGDRLETVEALEGPEDSITSVVVSPDGRWLASTGFDRAVRVWRVEGFSPWAVFRDQPATLYALCFSPDGRYVLGAGMDMRVRIWDLEARQQVHSLEGHRSTIYSLDFHPEGKAIASGSFDETVGLWRVELGAKGVEVKSFSRLDHHQSLVNGVTFSPDGRWLASTSNDRTVRIWDLEEERPLHTLDEHEATVWSVAFSPDGRWIATGGNDRKIRVWSTRTWEREALLAGHEGEIWSLTFTPDGESLLSGSHDSSLRLWDWRQERCRSRLDMLEDENQRIRCEGMRLEGAEGLSRLQRRFLRRKGAIDDHGESD